MPVLRSTPNHIPLKLRCPDYCRVRFRHVYLINSDSTLNNGHLQFEIGNFDCHFHFWFVYVEETRIAHMTRKHKRVWEGYCAVDRGCDGRRQSHTRTAAIPCRCSGSWAPGNGWWSYKPKRGWNFSHNLVKIWIACRYVAWIEVATFISNIEDDPLGKK